MMYKVLIVCALAQELAVVKKQIKEANLAGLKVDFLQTGMGNYNMIFALTKKLEQEKYDFIVNIGVAGFRGDVGGDILMKSDEKFYQVVNVLNICNQRELIVPVFFKFGKLASCINAELPIRNFENNFITLQKNIKIIFQSFSDFSSDCFLLDMESYGFEFVCEKYNLPRVVLKISVDFNQKDLDNFDYKKALDLLENALDYKKLLEEILDYLNRQKTEKLDLDKYFKILKFSQRQKEIFEILYRKYKFVVGEDFDEFFERFLEENKNEKNQKKLVGKLLEEIEGLTNG